METDSKLERLALFTDAVFAIAITLLVLDLKLPDIPKDIQNLNLWELYQPVINKFIAFLASFIVIAIFWMGHLSFIGLLQGFDSGLLFWNFVFLFFIITFPFTTSQLSEAFNRRFAPPLIIYYVNIIGVATSNFMLARHAFVRRPQLTYINKDLRKDTYTKMKYLIFFPVIISTGGILALLTGNGVYSLGSIFFIYIIIILRNKALKQPGKK